MIPSPSDMANREYWTTQLDEAFAFMEAMRVYPIEECGEPMVSLCEASDGLEVEFSTTLINRTHPRVFFVREGLIKHFRAAAREMNDRGWVLKIEDGYRSPEMQRAQSHNPAHFDVILEKVMWELNGQVPTPELMFRRLSALIATRCRIGTHISGSAIDISVFDRTTGNELERGGTYIEISERTPMASPFITEEERKNRTEITAIMHRNGWFAYPYEFWHFSSGDSYAESLAGTGRPGRYGPVAFDGKSITVIPEPASDEMLEPLEFYERQIKAALERRSNHRPTA
jgi:D-alanyl-D-alanine dipeptidase